MTAGRCDDPNCTCRSDELQWFTNSILGRDAAKTDYIVIPLMGGVLARCFLARDGPNPEGDNDCVALVSPHGPGTPDQPQPAG